MSDRNLVSLPACALDTIVAGTSTCARCAALGLNECEGVNQSLIDKLRAVARVRKFRPRETVVVEGGRADTIGIVRSGTAMVTKYMPDGRRQIIGFLHRGDIVGLPMESQFFASVEAATALDVCMFPLTVFDQLLRDDGAFSASIVKLVSNEVAEAAEHQIILGKMSAPERIAAFLLRIQKRQCDKHESENPIVIDVSRTDIGDYLGLSMEHVSRALHRFDEQGVIEIETPRRIRVHDQSALQRAAVGKP